MSLNLKMEPPKNDIKVQVNPFENTTKLIEWNVDMNVVLSGSKKRKFIKRIRNLLVCLVMVVFAVVISYLKGEIQTLQVQISDINTNLVILMLKYDKLDKNYNFLQRSYDKFQLNMNTRNLKKFSKKDFSSQTVQVAENRPKDDAEGVNLKSDNIERILSSADYFRNETVDPDDKEERISQSFNSESQRFRGRKEISRSRRSIVMFEKRNLTDVADSWLEESDENDDDDWESSEYRAARARRDDGRGKKEKKKKNKRRPKRSRRRLGPLIATFVGAQPEQHVTDSVYIGPWVKSSRNESRYNFNKFHLVEDKKSIEVTTNGLYMISTQIFYFGESTHYSYWILLSSEGASLTQKLAKCATVSAVTDTEVSCHTSIIIPLKRGDRVRVQQQERNRLINLREGHSYIQIALLTSDNKKRRIS
ncbi:uncharacterized protein LOC117167481 isoform X2 [Belonocnema kinseyi]|uniref:uncharacterized protein LOC117167481 isoform X2 n=1 Tax=Belonocnema kinseyi TaxID=2817044 RepID=UPI00143DB016|nr:uncharacterized protein LOC117167481 isoform X2 [Belonocnema kinseyi]